MLTKTHIAVAQNASGRNLNVPVYRLSQGNAGPKVYIQSSIHGAEVQGNVVIFQLLRALKNLKIHGEITLVPNCNPVGTNIKAGEYTLGRFDPVNGTNWNRGYYYNEQAIKVFADSVTANCSVEKIKREFTQYWQNLIHEKLAQSWGLALAQDLNLHLQLMANEADIVMDLHNGPVATRHIYIPKYAESEVAFLSMPHNILIPNRFAGALDEASFCPWWTLSDLLRRKYAKNYDFNKFAFTFEIGSQEVIDFAEGERDALNILAYLSRKGVIDTGNFEALDTPRYVVELEDYKTLYTEFGGMVDYLAKPGAHLKKGELLAKVLNVDELDNEKAVRYIEAPCDLIAILHFPSASVLSGTQLYKCFTNYRQL